MRLTGFPPYSHGQPLKQEDCFSVVLLSSVMAEMHLVVLILMYHLSPPIGACGLLTPRAMLPQRRSGRCGSLQVLGLLITMVTKEPREKNTNKIQIKPLGNNSTCLFSFPTPESRGRASSRVTKVFPNSWKTAPSLYTAEWALTFSPGCCRRSRCKRWTQ